MRLIRAVTRPLALACLGVLCCLPAEELPKAEGVDVVRAAKAIAGALSGPESSVAQGKAWEQDIAGLTDARPEIHTQAMAALIRRGTPVVGDLTVLAKDQDPALRMRVAAVLAAIGGEDATSELLRMSHDRDRGVIEVATLGLGKARGAGSFERLAEILQSSDPSLRQAAARGLGMHGDARGLGLLCGYVRDRDDLVRRDMRENLARIANTTIAVPVLAELIATRTGGDRIALIDATGEIGDPRLSPVLASVLTQPDVNAATLAARMLSVNGDSRAVQALCRVAAQARESVLREEAAQTLRRLTSHTAAAGTAWELWWRDHSAEVAALEARDRLLAELHDPARSTTSAELAAFPVSALFQLVDGSLGNGALWWPARAFAALSADVPARWTSVLFDRIERTLDLKDRVRVIVLLDELNDPGATEGFKRLYVSLRNQPEVKAAALGPERVALRVALDRRGVHLQ
jgi:HEAT repeat protein